MPRITPNLWFDTESKAAAEFYVSIFPKSKITDITYYQEGTPRPGEVLTVNFVLDGNEFTAIDGGPEFTFDEAISFSIECADQEEVDYYWDKLTADGGEESQCGWCKDKFGLSWQVVPLGFEKMMNDPDSARAQRAMQAMYKMKKLDLAALQAAADGA